MNLPLYALGILLGIQLEKILTIPQEYLLPAVVSVGLVMAVEKYTEVTAP